MTGQMIDPQESGLAAEWLLIMERLKVNDLAEWIADHRRGDRNSNPKWRSWEGIARLIHERTRVTVSTGGLRVRWTDAVDEILSRERPDGTRAATDAADPTGPAGSLGSELPAGSNRGEATP